MAVSPDGNTVVSTAGETGLVHRWDAATGRALPPYREALGVVGAVAYSPDGQMLAVGTANNDQGSTVWLLEAATGKRLRTLVDPIALFVFSLAFSADGRTLLCSQFGGTRLWDVATGKVLRRLPGLTSYGRVALSPDGQIIATQDQEGFGGLPWWSTKPRDKDGQIIAGTGGNRPPRLIHLWQASTGKELRTLHDPDKVTVATLDFSPDSKTLASRGSDETVKLWDVATGRLLWRAKGRQNWFLAFSPDGKSLALGGKDRVISLWEIATRKERWQLGKHRSAVRCGAFSRDGKLLATGSGDSTILVWDLAAAAGTASQSPLSARELDALWADLVGADAVKAFQAIHRLAAAPKQTLPFLREHLKPVLAPDRKRVRKLVDMLDSADFPTQQKAADELEKLVDAASSLLRQIVEKEKPSLEVRRRLQQILDAQEHGETLRGIRAVEVLEWIATPDTVRLIDELANGAPDARLTREAIAALGRMRK